MIDNFEKIYDFLNFESNVDDECYSVYVVRRGKDQKIPSNIFDIVKTYCIISIEQLKDKEEEIKKLCEFFNARAYIDVTKRKRRNFLLKMIECIADSISRNTNESFERIFENSCKHCHIPYGETRWLVDIDTKEEIEIKNIKECLQKCKFGDSELITLEIPTKKGFHLITKPFHKRNFIEMYGIKNVTVLEHTFTLLYYKNYEKEGNKEESREP